MRTKHGHRMTKELITAYTAGDATVDAQQLDAALHDFDLDYSVKKKMAQRNIDTESGALNANQLAAVMRRTSSLKDTRR